MISRENTVVTLHSESFHVYIIYSKYKYKYKYMYMYKYKYNYKYKYKLVYSI